MNGHESADDVDGAALGRGEPAVVREVASHDKDVALPVHSERQACVFITSKRLRFSWASWAAWGGLPALSR